MGNINYDVDIFNQYINAFRIYDFNILKKLFNDLYQELKTSQTKSNRIIKKYFDCFESYYLNYEVVNINILNDFVPIIYKIFLIQNMKVNRIIREICSKIILFKYENLKKFNMENKIDNNLLIMDYIITSKIENYIIKMFKYNLNIYE